jgi:putative thiamine transport system permease protein
VLGFGALLGVYGAVMLSLLVGSVAGLWPFPQLLPQALTWQAWATVAGSLPTVGTTLSLALASAVAALIWSVAWLEYAPPAWDRPLRPLLYLPLVLPPVLWVVGVHGLTLRLGCDGRWAGLWLAHTLAAVPYVLIALSPAYLGFEARHQQVCASLGHGRAVFLWRVKWPLLRAALSAGLAIGFAVSVAQYLPTLFVGGGRFATVTTEAVTGASGAQRSLTSAYALLQWGLPLLLWAWAARWGRPRRFKNPDNGGS